MLWGNDRLAGVLERCALSAATAWGFYLMARFVNERWRMAALEKRLSEAQGDLEHERVKRKADRVGRIRAEQELRAARVQLQQLQLQLTLRGDAAPEAQAASAAGDGGGAADGGEAAAAAGAEAAAEGQAGEPGAAGGGAGGDDDAAAGGGGGGGGTAVAAAQRAAAAAAASLAASGAALPAYPFRPIGHLRSVFSERNGTPRQPQLVPAARSRLVLAPGVPRDCLEGLEQYSHVWVLYVFHANTDLAKYLSADRSGLKAKIHVPRLNGGRMGVLATRSPHRPSPIGLSTARVLGRQGGCLLLGGADIVDGSPVLDVKPYVPFCDCLPAATAPAWVQAEADDEPLAVAEVVVGEAARSALLRAWGARRSHSMYDSADSFMELVRQVLSRDIRSVNQRLNVHPVTAAAAATRGMGGGGSKTGGKTAGRGPSTQQQHHPPPSQPVPHTTHTGSTFALQAAALHPAVAVAAAATVSHSSGADAAAAAGAPSETGVAAAGGRAHAECAGAAGGADLMDAVRPPGQGGGGGRGQYHVVLENVYISYDITPEGVVHVVDAWVDPVTAR